RPCGLTLEDEVVAALERNEARVLDAGRQTPPFLEGYSRIAAAMHHQRWGPDLRQKLLDVDLRRRSQAPHRVLRGGRDALQVIEPLRLLGCAAGHELRGEDLAEGRIFLAPALQYQRAQRVRLLDLLATAAFAHATSEAAIEHEMRHAL